MSLTCLRLLIHPALVGNVFLIDRIIALVFSLSRTTSSPDPLPLQGLSWPPNPLFGGSSDWGGVVRKQWWEGGKGKLWPISNLNQPSFSPSFLYLGNMLRKAISIANVIFFSHWMIITFNRLTEESSPKPQQGCLLCPTGIWLKNKLVHLFWTIVLTWFVYKPADQTDQVNSGQADQRKYCHVRRRSRLLVLSDNTKALLHSAS